METLLIDIGALAVFLGYMAIVYWHGTSRDAQRDRRRVTDESPNSSWRGSGSYRIGF